MRFPRTRLIGSREPFAGGAERRLPGVGREVDLMQGMNSMGRGWGTFRRVWTGAVFGLAATLLAAVPAVATPAIFDPIWGFQEAGLEGLPSGTMDEFGGDTWLLAGEGGGMGMLDVELSGTTNLCLFTASSPVCQSDTSGITGAYSAIATLTVSAVHSAEISGPFTLFMSGLPGSGYSTSEVTLELNPTVPMGLDTSGIPGFGFQSLVHVEDVTEAPFPIYHYVGWRVQLGDTFSMRYDVLTAPEGRAAPQLMVNAIGRAIVPEPGTALLMGLGLACLATGKRRRIGESD